MIAHEDLLRLLRYDPLTGQFIRLVTTGSRGQVGSVAGSLDVSHGYFSVGVGGQEYYAHRLAWFYMTGAWPIEQVDHRNTNRSDNRWANLRPASQGQNKTNVSPSRRNTSGKKGVTWHSRASKWMAQIGVNGKRVYLGVFDSVDEAHAAYRSAAIELHGDFANFGA